MTKKRSMAMDVRVSVETYTESTLLAIISSKTKNMMKLKIICDL